MPQLLNLIAITVRDYDEAIAFYTQKLGGWHAFAQLKHVGVEKAHG